MSATSVKFLPPTNLTAYNPSNQPSPSSQPPSIPQTFIDAMKVRVEVFVNEQRCSLVNEVDADDSRSCHWVIYSSPNNESTEGETPHPNPVGTIRLVPFPHPAHPEPGSSWAPPPPSASLPSTDPSLPVPPSSLPFITDRPTTFHDGTEPYIKLGRLAVLSTARGSGIASKLVNTALSWIQENPTFFNPGEGGEEKVWKGLVCAHAQIQVSKMWERYGFVVDEEMGTWDEEGIQHVGMFRRLDLGKKEI